VYQPRRVASCGQHLGHHVFLADVGLGNVLDRGAVLGGQRLRVGSDALAQRQRELRVVEDADAARMQKARHALGKACPGQRAGDDEAVVARQHARQVARVPRRQQLHRSLRSGAVHHAASVLPCLVPARPA
jgi:hypothetical protein